MDVRWTQWNGIIILLTEYEHQTCAAYLLQWNGNADLSRENRWWKSSKGNRWFFKVTRRWQPIWALHLLKNGFLKSSSRNDKRSFLLLPTAKAVQLVNETYEEYMKEMHILKRIWEEMHLTAWSLYWNWQNDILPEERAIKYWQKGASGNVGRYVVNMLWQDRVKGRAVWM